MTTNGYINEAIELDARSSNGIDVRLFWCPGTNTVTVSVFDSTKEQVFELAVDPSEAREAFHHPFAYAAFQGMSSCPSTHSRAAPLYGGPFLCCAR
jgi:hypothetical protein